MTSAKYFKFRGIVKTEIGIETTRYGIYSLILFVITLVAFNSLSSAEFRSVSSGEKFMLFARILAIFFFLVISAVCFYFYMKSAKKEEKMLQYIERLQYSTFNDDTIENGFYTALKNMLENGRIEPKTATL